MQAASLWVAEHIGLKKVVHRKKNEPRGKRRIEGDIKRLKQDINFLGWKLKRIEVVPVVIGALGSVTKQFNKWIGKIGIGYNVGIMQKTALLGTARILRKVLEM